ncbi:benzoate 4-monooxygenase cytochrome P450 [Aspergillus aurantiobrunneus]
MAHPPSILVSHLVVFFYLALTAQTGRQIISGYLLALFSSISIYRLFFHRLKHFLGPILASTTKIWYAWKARNSKNLFFPLHKMQREYGNFVRTGPSEITVFHPDVFMAVDGPSGKCSKAEWYDLLHPNTGLVTTQDKELHRERRRRWNRGFTSKALVQYKNKILPSIKQLDDCIKANVAAGQVSGVSDLDFWLTFDRMGELFLGKSFDMLTHQRWHAIILLLQKAMSLLGPLWPTPWAVQIVFKLMPRVGVSRDWFTMVGWCESQVRKIQMPDKIPPRAPILAHYLRHETPGTNSHEALTGDSISAIVAGSKPTASALVGLYELAKSPAQADKIRDEILQQGADIHDSNSLARCCPHLEAAIFETLRLYPSIPSAGNRKTSSKEGITIGGTYIPPETTVVGPRFVIGRPEIIEDCFEDADQFVPERWTTRLEMVRNRAAFAPFGTALGSKSCIGRALAMNDLMLVTAHVVYQCRMRLQSGETGDAVLDNWCDNFTSTLGRLRLVFEIREDKHNGGDGGSS